MKNILFVSRDKGTWVDELYMSPTLQMITYRYRCPVCEGINENGQPDCCPCCGVKLEKSKRYKEVIERLRGYIRLEAEG